MKGVIALFNTGGACLATDFHKSCVGKMRPSLDSGLKYVHTKSDECPTVLGPRWMKTPIVKPFVPPRREEDPCCSVRRQGSLVALSS